jgi:hypothetical protein
VRRERGVIQPWAAGSIARFYGPAGSRCNAQTGGAKDGSHWVHLGHAERIPGLSPVRAYAAPQVLTRSPPPTSRMETMVDCFDRIAVHMTELALEPVRQLKDRRMLGAVSLRTPSNGHRFLVTIAKRLPAGDLGAPVFVWTIAEISGEGDELAEGLRCASPAGTSHDEPEEAYWAAINTLCTLTT